MPFGGLGSLQAPAPYAPMTPGPQFGEGLPMLGLSGLMQGFSHGTELAMEMGMKQKALENEMGYREAMLGIRSGNEKTGEERLAASKAEAAAKLAEQQREFTEKQNAASTKAAAAAAAAQAKKEKDTLIYLGGKNSPNRQAFMGLLKTNPDTAQSIVKRLAAGDYSALQDLNVSSGPALGGSPIAGLNPLGLDLPK